MDSPKKECPKCGCAQSTSPAVQPLGRSLGPIEPKHGGSIPPEWTYENLSEWPELCRTGKLQSPIDFRKGIYEKLHEFAPFKFSGYDIPITGILLNNGRTINISIGTGQERPKISGGDLIGEYLLDSFHFHWPSEHTVNGERYDLESHLVHYSSKYDSVATALNFDGVAVLGTLFKVSPNPLDSIPTIEALNEKVPSVSQEIDKHVTVNVPNLMGFLPPNPNEFYRYWGSLTTPGCNEKVLWTVFGQRNLIEKKSFEILTNIKNEKGEIIRSNYRPVQDENNRHPKYYFARGFPEMPLRPV